MTLDRPEIAVFARALATSFARGIPLIDALDTIAESTDSSVLQGAITMIRKDVMQGIQLNHTMRQTGAFPDAVINKVTDAEQIGALDIAFDEVATSYEKPVGGD